MLRGEMAYIPMIIRRGVCLGLHELSDGYQAVLVIMFDLILRYAYLFSTLKDPLEGSATVIIDEVDLHLHVRWQRTVLRHAAIGSVFVETLLFGADSRYSIQVQADEEEVRRLRREVEAGRATEADRKRLFALLNHLEELMAAEEERRGEGPLMSEMAKLQRAFLQDLAAELDER